MNVLHYKIKSPIDIETLSDVMAGYYAAIRVTQTAIIEIVFDDEIADKTRQHIDGLMSGLGAEPIAA